MRLTDKPGRAASPPRSAESPVLASCLQRLDRCKSRNLRSLGHYHPAHNTGAGSEHHVASGADAIEEWAADKQKNDNLGGH
jgi:hypothetical protein